MKRFCLSSILAVFVFLVLAMPVKAGFGISPPYVKTSKPVFAGSRFEQKITLLRSSAEDDLLADISVNAPELEGWVSINKGNEFELPKGQLQIPMVVQIDVPQDAEIGNYKGYINIKIKPKGDGRTSGVSIALGARVDIDLTVTDEPMTDFTIRKVSIPSFEKLGKPWEWKIFSWFFYRIKVVMRIENIGNVKTAPTSVKVDVWDLSENSVLESHIDDSIEKVEPFETQNVIASFPTELDTGQYWGNVSIYKDNEIIYKDKLIITIEPQGTLGTKVGIWAWTMLAGWLAIIGLFVLALIKIRIWKHVFRVLSVVLWPFLVVLKYLMGLFRKFKIGFLRWVHSKTASSLNIDNNDRKKKSK